jgi:hypothetical protein
VGVGGKLKHGLFLILPTVSAWHGFFSGYSCCSACGGDAAVCVALPRNPQNLLTDLHLDYRSAWLLLEVGERGWAELLSAACPS